MDGQAIERILAACESELAAGRRVDLRARGFWRAVAAVKRDRALIDSYADRIADIDRGAFRRAVPLRAPAVVGVVVLTGGTLFGVAALALAPILGEWRSLAVLFGTGVLMGTTHSLAHVVVGRAVGIRFTDAYADIPRRPQPGMKTDYASYLRASPTGRAWMHASGAIVTKIVPFAAIPYAAAVGCETWAILALLALGVVGILTDALFSVRASDWKKFRREMRYAKPR